MIRFGCNRDGGKRANSAHSTTCGSQRSGGGEGERREQKGLGWYKGLLYPDHIWGSVSECVSPPRSSETGNREDRTFPSSLHPALRAQPSDRSWGQGGGGGRQLVPRAPSSSSSLRLLRGLDHARSLRAPTRRGARCPAQAPPYGSQDPALDSPLSISLPFLAVAAFPMTGRWKEGVREGNRGWSRPRRSTG